MSQEEVSFSSVGVEDLDYFPKFCRATNVNGKLYVTGGEMHSLAVNVVDSHSLDLDPAKGMKFCRSAHTLVNLNNTSLLAISGAYGETSCEIYSIEKNSWSYLVNVNYGRVGVYALIYGGDSIYLFFGKKFNTGNRKWEFVRAVEKINLYEPFPKWMEVNFKSKSADVNRLLCFASIVACPNEIFYVFGGQIVNDDHLVMTTNTIVIDMEQHTFDLAELTVPKFSCFLENNFYFYNSTAINYDNEGSVFLSSIISNEMWIIESA